MGGLSAAAASRKPSSLQRKKKGLPGGLHMLFLEYSESDNYSETPWYYFLPQPDATQRTRRTALSRVPELFHVSVGLRFRVWIKSAHQEERPPTPPQTVAGEI
jgi:hypothetical protein